MVMLGIWLVLCALVGSLANSRGRSGFGFFLLSAVLSPLLGVIVCLCMRNEKKHAEKLAQDAQRRNAEYEAKERDEVRNEVMIELLKEIKEGRK